MNSNLPSLINNPQASVAGKIFWFVPKRNTEISHSDLVVAVTAAGLDASKVIALADSRAFKRGIDNITRGMLRDEVTHKDTEIVIQISKRIRVPDGIDYTRSATVRLDKLTGTVTCPDPSFEADAKVAFNKAMGTKKTRDITSLIERLIAPRINKDVFPMYGGTFLALPTAFSFVDQLVVLTKTLQWQPWNFPVPEEATVVQNQTQTQVQQIVVDSFSETLEEVKAHLHTINSESRGDKVQRAYDTLSDLQVKLQTNARLAGNGLAILEDQLAYLEKLLGKRQVTPPEENLIPPANSVVSNDEGDDCEESEPEVKRIIVSPSTPIYDGEVTLGNASDIIHNPDPSHGLNCNIVT